jgi:hypothetical protein
MKAARDGGTLILLEREGVKNKKEGGDCIGRCAKLMARQIRHVRV